MHTQEGSTVNQQIKNRKMIHEHKHARKNEIFPKKNVKHKTKRNSKRFIGTSGNTNIFLLN